MGIQGNKHNNDSLVSKWSIRQVILIFAATALVMLSLEVIQIPFLGRQTHPSERSSWEISAIAPGLLNVMQQDYQQQMLMLNCSSLSKEERQALIDQTYQKAYMDGRKKGYAEAMDDARKKEEKERLTKEEGKEKCPPCEKCKTISPMPGTASIITQGEEDGPAPVLNPEIHRGRRKPGEEPGPRGYVWQERGYNFYPFRDMFFYYNTTNRSADDFRSLVLITGGRSGMENIDNLITLWGFEHFDYVIMHFDDSSSEWNKYDWYKYVVGVTAQKQAKFWYYKRFAAPWLVKSYRYLHFVDSDAGSPPEQPFNLTLYESFLHDNGLLIAQPAVTPKGRSSDHAVCRVHNDSLYRWTSVVENGPFYSVSQTIYKCYWEMINADSVSGWGPDSCWCQYAHEVCGYPQEQACAVVDAFPIDHLDKKTASGQKYRGREYWMYGFDDWHMYETKMQKLLTSEFQKHAGYFHTIGAVPRPAYWKPGTPPEIPLHKQLQVFEKRRREADAKELEQIAARRKEEDEEGIRQRSLR